MLKVITTVAAGVILAFSAQSAMAVGFGRLVNGTILGQSLDVSVALSADANDQITSNCVSAEVAVGDTLLAHQAVRVRLEPSANDGSRSLHVTTTVRIHEPVVSVTVSVACPSRISRQFVVFVDPPMPAFEAPAAAMVPPVAASAVESAAVPEPVVARGPEVVVDRPTAAAPMADGLERRPARSVAKSATPSVAESKVAARRAKASVRKARRTPPAEVRARAASRLQLERSGGAVLAAPVVAAASAASESALAMPAGVSASAAAPTDAERAAELQRDAIQALQQRLDKLQAESEASGKKLDQLQARLKDAEASRTTGWTPYAVTAGGAALLLWVGLWIGRRSSSARPGAPWWNAEAGPASAGPAAAGATMKSAFAVSGMASLPEAVELSDDAPTTDPVPLVVSAALPAEPPRVSKSFDDTVASVGSAVSAPAPRLTADELIDLDQQAEFFVALGQDDSAIDLLNAFLRGSGGASPLAYLKLLEIHRRRDEQDAYERVRERHDRRFGHLAPRWSDPSAAAHGTIEDHPDAMGKVQSAWADPARAMDTVEALLVGSEPPDSPFDLSSYADLQFLYQLARSVLAPDAPAVQAAAVDLLLPLSRQDEPRAVFASIPSTPRTGDGGGAVDSGFSSASDVDLELDLLPPRTDPTPAG